MKIGADTALNRGKHYAAGLVFKLVPLYSVFNWCITIFKITITITISNGGGFLVLNGHL